MVFVVETDCVIVKGWAVKVRTLRSLVARLPTVEKWFWCEFATEADLSVLCPLS